MQIAQYERMEGTVNKAIVMAEKTGDQIKSSARDEAEAILENAKNNANKYFKSRGHEKYPATPAKSNKINTVPINKAVDEKERANFLLSLQETMHKMKISDMNINATIPIELRSNPNVNVKFLLDGRSIPGIITTTTSNNFNTTRKEIERTERRMGGPTK